MKNIFLWILKFLTQNLIEYYSQRILSYKIKALEITSYEELDKKNITNYRNYPIIELLL